MLDQCTVAPRCLRYVDGSCLLCRYSSPIRTLCALCGLIRWHVYVGISSCDDFWRVWKDVTNLVTYLPTFCVCILCVCFCFIYFYFLEQFKSSVIQFIYGNEVPITFYCFWFLFVIMILYYLDLFCYMRDRQRQKQRQRETETQRERKRERKGKTYTCIILRPFSVWMLCVWLGLLS